MITVFYDGKCGMCRREIEHYKRVAPMGVFEWVDITTNPKPFTNLGFAVGDGLRALHVRDSAQKMHIGVEAFIVIWRQIPRWKILALLGNLPLIKPMAKIAYNCFANWRFKRLGYGKCDI